MVRLNDSQILANYDLRSMLSRVADIVAFEGPILTLYKNKIGDALYLFDWVDGDADGNYWLVYRVDKTQVEKFIQAEISHLDLFQSGEDYCYIVQIDAGAQWKQLQKIPKSSIPHDWHPSKEIFFDPSDCPDLAYLKSALKALQSNTSLTKIHKANWPASVHTDRAFWEKFRQLAGDNSKLHFKRFIKV